MATTWNGSDQSANITLTGGSLIATTTSSTQGSVRATYSTSTALVYIEHTLVVLAGASYTLGWANAAELLSVAPGGTDKDGVGFTPNSSGSTFFNNVNLGNIGAGVALLTVCQAINFTSKLVWTRYNNGLWNNSATADPASGTGGFSFSAINAGPFFPIFSANGSGASVQTNFGATDFGYAVPSGFSSPDSDTQAYAASSKFEGLAILSPPINAASASKFEGLAVLSPPANAVSASKFLGYAILNGPIATARISFSASGVGFALLPSGVGSASIALSPSGVGAAIAITTAQVFLGGTLNAVGSRGLSGVGLAKASFSTQAGARSFGASVGSVLAAINLLSLAPPLITNMLPWRSRVITHPLTAPMLDDDLVYLLNLSGIVGGTVAALPVHVGPGARGFVTDATATTFLSIVAGGGANRVPVIYDGSNWIIG